MSTYTSILYQLIWSTKGRKRVLAKENRKRLFSYMSQILENKKCHVYRINGVEDHLHIVFSLHPTIALSSLVKDLKLASTELIKAEKLFLNFDGWQDGYGAFTYSLDAKDNLIEYVKNQEEHHAIRNFEAEYRSMLQEFKIEFKEEFLF